MLEFAQFSVLTGTNADTQDYSFRLDSNNPTRVFESFDLIDLNTERTVMVMFKVAESGSTHLAMTFNGQNTGIGPQIMFTLNSPSDSTPTPRSWHHVLPGDAFKAYGNHLFVQAGYPIPETGDAFFVVSDLAIIYHVKVDLG
jgi:hypothetical protein